MASNGGVGSVLWRKARTKTVLTKRYAFHRKMDSADDQEACTQNDFTSCFIDESESDGEDLADEEGKLLEEPSVVFPDDHPRNGRSCGRLAGCQDDNDDADASEPLTGVSKISGKKFDFGSHGVSPPSPKDGIDFVDMGVARDEDFSVHDYTDQGLGRGDPQHHSILKEGNLKSRPKKSSSRSRKRPRKTFQPSVTFGCLDMFIGIFAIVIFFIDIGTDIELAIHYFNQKMWDYGGVTTGLILFPSFVTCFLGLHWYIIDYRKEKEVVDRLTKAKKKAYITPTRVWFLRIFFTALQMGPVVRIVEYLYCGHMSQSKKLTERERRRYYRFMLYEDVDSCLLRLFESFLEAAPQLTWQLYIVMVLKPKEDVVGTSMRAAALLSSWASLAVSLVSYHKSLRNSHEEKAKMSIASLPFYFVWRASEIGGRVLCIAMFGSAFRFWVFGPLVFHWVFISGWLMMQKTTFYKNSCLERAFNIICGYVMIFCFLNLREGRTRFRFLLFYVIVYIENFFMLTFWFRFSPDLGAWFHLGGFIVVLILFVLHITAQLLYYAFFHPTKNIQLCVPCDPYIIYSSICYDVHPGIDDVVGQPSERYTVSEVVDGRDQRLVDDNSSHNMQHTSL
ncbi:XK-related protein 6 [Aplysia californica]|uniref:XK-related protein n=1 Tax=Aplysia californica TaxID=6500 RepID=A0ABM0JZ12_APLCA|nr:XK-related protein 6 [Aplysia californica]